MQYQLVNITPEAATAILKGNKGNRKPRQSHIEALADAMLRGEWKQTHQGIAISPTGKLLDGQHRLLAVVKSGSSCCHGKRWANARSAGSGSSPPIQTT